VHGDNEIRIAKLSRGRRFASAFVQMGALELLEVRPWSFECGSGASRDDPCLVRGCQHTQPCGRQSDVLSQRVGGCCCV
jgi:hypothetical protein